MDELHVPLRAKPARRSFLRRVAVIAASTALVISGAATAKTLWHDAHEPFGLSEVSQSVEHLAGIHQAPIYRVGMRNTLLNGMANGPSTGPKEASSPMADPSMSGHIGQIQNAPRMTVVFWGSYWKNDPKAVKTMAEVLNFYARLRGSAFAKALTQYGGASAEPTFEGAYIDAQNFESAGKGSEKVTVQSAAIEAERVAFALNLQQGVNTQVDFVLFPGVKVMDGILQVGGFHYTAGNLTYAVIGNYGIATPVVASHEYAEAVTDPNLLSYRDASGQEIGDVCEKLPPVMQSGIWITKFYSGATKSCTAPKLAPTRELGG